MSNANSILNDSQKPQKKVVIVATEDWFVLSHFQPLIQSLQAQKYQVYILARASNAQKALLAMGCMCLDAPVHRELYGIKSLSLEYHSIKNILSQISPDVVHCIALRMCVLAGFAAIKLGIQTKILAITGMGYLAVAKGLKASFVRFVLRKILRYLGKQNGVYWLFENTHDPKSLKLTQFSDHTFYAPGAGVDMGLYPPSALPPLPLKLACVARMVQSKGIDRAVAAVSQLNKKGYDITLSLFGDIDEANPQSYSLSQMQAFAALKGINWNGASNNIAKVWREHHGALLLSRGGEGLPKSLLEAAAAGRAIITSNVPGCADFVDESMGFVVDGNSNTQIEQAILSLHHDLQKLNEMGQSARDKVFRGHTTQRLEECFKSIYEKVSNRE